MDRSEPQEDRNVLSWMNPRILITGGSGLLALNWALAVRDRFSPILGLHERDVSVAGAETVRLDLESADRLVAAFEALQPHIVVHAAGLASVERCESDPALARHINVDLASNVAEACAKLALPLVHISTDHLFSGAAAMVDEVCPPAPINVYGRTKAEAESRVLDAHPQALVIRTNFYGWGPSYRQSFSDWIIRSLRARREIALFEDVFYTPILIEALAEAVHDLIDLKAAGIFHVVGDDRISKFEFGTIVAKEFGLDVGLIQTASIRDRKSLVQRPRDMSLTNEKTCKTIARKLGVAAEQIARLHRQEQDGHAREVRDL